MSAVRSPGYLSPYCRESQTGSPNTSLNLLDTILRPVRCSGVFSTNSTPLSFGVLTLNLRYFELGNTGDSGTWSGSIGIFSWFLGRLVFFSLWVDLHWEYPTVQKFCRFRGGVSCTGLEGLGLNSEQGVGLRATDEVGLTGTCCKILVTWVRSPDEYPELALRTGVLV